MNMQPASNGPKVWNSHLIKPVLHPLRLPKNNYLPKEQKHTHIESQGWKQSACIKSTSRITIVCVLLGQLRWDTLIEIHAGRMILGNTLENLLCTCFLCVGSFRLQPSQEAGGCSSHFKDEKPRGIEGRALA